MSVLRVENLSVAVNGKVILKNVSLNVKSGELLAIMGPNGSGKTTLAYTIMGHLEYTVISGRIILDNENITNLPAHERSLRGIFLAFQNPVEVHGLRLSTLIFAALNKRKGEINLMKGDPIVLSRLMRITTELGLTANHLQREVNVGFSGGEKKRSELLQAMMLEPKFVIMDEPDSGLDVDGIKIVASKIKEFLDRGTGVIVITHYARLLRFLEPDNVIVLKDGSIIASGDSYLPYIIEEKGYNAI